MKKLVTKMVVGFLCIGSLQTVLSSKVSAEDSAGIVVDRGTVVVSDRAKRLHERAIVIDGHNDLPWELRSQGSIDFKKLDISQPQASMHTDIPRLRQGGMGAQFWSVYVPAKTAYNGTALVATLEQIELVRAMLDRYPETFEFAGTVEDIRRIRASGKIASLIGVEGGHCIENSISVLRQLYKLGARYMTLTHSDSLNWADSATDKPRVGGLSPFGEDVIKEMNRLGMMVDLSHVSAETMKHALQVTTAPVIYSHSSARNIADHPRNVPDDVLRLVKDNGGVVMVNFFSGYVVPSSAERCVRQMQHENELEKELDETELRAEMRKWSIANPMDPGNVHHVVDHIDHIVKVAGIDHVGLGSDYDGVGVLPKQLEDVSTYPVITQVLLDRGYSEEEVIKILGENLLVAMERVEEVAQELQRPSESRVKP